MNEMMNREIRMTSVEVTEMINQFREMEGNKSELQHKHLMEKLRKETEVLESLGLGNQPNFRPVEYLDKKGETRPCYSLNRDGILQICMSESALVRYKMIEYINKLESELEKTKLPQTYKEALIALVASVEENEKLALTIQEQKPMVEFSETVLKSKDNINMETMAKIISDEGIKIGRNRLFEFLRDESILKADNIPYHTYMERGWFKVTEKIKNTAYGDKLYAVTLVTPKGQVAIVGLVKDKYIA